MSDCQCIYLKFYDQALHFVGSWKRINCALSTFKDDSYPVPKYSCRRRDVLICKFLLLLKFLTNGWEKPPNCNVLMIIDDYNHVPLLVSTTWRWKRISSFTFSDSLVNYPLPVWISNHSLFPFISTPFIFSFKNHQELPSFIKYIGCCGYRWWLMTANQAGT